MQATTRIAFATLAAAALLCAGPRQQFLQASEEIPAPKTQPTSAHAWTLPEALEQLKLHPRDPYLQYVALQLARREGKVDEVIGQLGGADGNGRPNRAAKVDLFGMFAGALAVQESLQLDTMRGGQPARAAQTGAALEVLPAPDAVVPVTVYKPVTRTEYKEVKETVVKADGGTSEVVRKIPYTVCSMEAVTVMRRVTSDEAEEIPAPKAEDEPVPLGLPPASRQGDSIVVSLSGGRTLKFSAAARPTREQIAEMVQDHLDDALIIDIIRFTRWVYDLPADDMIWLKQQGVSDAVISAMMRPATPEQVPPPKEAHEPSYSLTPASPGSATALANPKAPIKQIITFTQICFTTPTGTKISTPAGGPPIETPGRHQFGQGGIYRLQLTHIEGRPGLELYPTLEVVPSNPKTEEFLDHNAVPVAFTNDDFEQISDGNYVVKVIYRPDPQNRWAAATEEIVSTRLEPGTDPIKEAQRRGSILLVIRMGNIEKIDGAPQTSAAPPTGIGSPAASPYASVPMPQGAAPPSGKAAFAEADEAEEIPAPTTEEAEDAPPPAAEPVEPAKADPAALEARRKEIMDISCLQGPTIKSHPWKKMLAGKNPEVSPLSLCVPADFYFVEFHSLSKLLELMDTADQWGTFIYSQSVHDARSQKVADRLQTQLALESTALLRPFYDLVVDEVAITGSDLFIREGSDVTLLFRVKQEKLFKQRMSQFLANAAKARPDARKTKAHLLGVEYVHLATPDRAVSVFACDPAPGLHVRTNSKVALRRVLEAIQGKTAGGRTVRRLGEMAEFKYIRTLMPRGAQEEDGFIYLSDPFVRHMVSPRLKLTERRRLLAYNHLRMIGHAAQLYRTEFGKAPTSLDDLAETECAPGKFNEGDLTAADGGRYTLSADGNGGVCSRHGTAHFLTPLCELPIREVTGEEADLYDAFVKDYEQYWRTYFDPIALRVQVTDKRVRLETIVLPLIDSTVYSTLAKVLGGETEHLDALPVPKRNLFSVSVKINREGILKELLKEDKTGASAKGLKLLAGDEAEVGSFAVTMLGYALHQSAVSTHAAVTFAEFQALGSLGSTLGEAVGAKDGSELALSGIRFLLRGVGTQVGLHVYDQGVPFDLNLASLLGQMLGTFSNGNTSVLGADVSVMGMALPVAACTAPGYISFTVQDEKIVDDFLNKLDKVGAPLIRQAGGSNLLEVPIDLDSYKVSLKGGTVARSFAVRFGPARFRIHWARIGKGLYITNQLGVLEDLEAANAQLPTCCERDRGPKAHAMVRMRARNWDQALPSFALSWAENNRQACLHNQGPLSSVARALSAVPPGEEAKPCPTLASIEACQALTAIPLGQEVKRPLSWDDRTRRVLEHARRVYGTDCCCPDGGRYVVSADGKSVSCSVHGSVVDSRQSTAPAADSASARLMRDFADLTAALTFTKDGLRAVVTIDRK